MSKLCVVMPVGPNTRVEFLIDTIESILFWCGNETFIFCLCDRFGPWPSGLGNGNIVRIDTSPDHGRLWSLYRNQCKGFLKCIQVNDCSVVLKMDTDTLVIGPMPHLDAIEFFSSNPAVGNLGSVHNGVFGGLEQHRYIQGAVRNLIEAGNCRMREIYRMARNNGYQVGDHCQGGAHFISMAAITRMNELGLLSVPMFESDLEDDFIVSMFVEAAGFKQVDFPIIGTLWEGLPMTPQSMADKGHKIAHSVEYFGRMDEWDIREQFKRQRINNANQWRNIKGI